MVSFGSLRNSDLNKSLFFAIFRYVYVMGGQTVDLGQFQSRSCVCMFIRYTYIFTHTYMYIIIYYIVIISIFNTIITSLNEYK